MASQSADCDVDVGSESGWSDADARADVDGAGSSDAGGRAGVDGAGSSDADGDAGSSAYDASPNIDASPLAFVPGEGSLTVSAQAYDTGPVLGAPGRTAERNGTPVGGKEAKAQPGEALRYARFVAVVNKRS